MDTKHNTATKLTSAIKTWREASFKDNSAFQKQLETLYKSLVEVTQDPLGQGQQQIKEFLTEDSKHVDRCVRWHLLKLAIHNARSGTGTSNARSGTRTGNAHMDLAIIIMASTNDGWNQLFYKPTGNKMKNSCKLGNPPPGKQGTSAWTPSMNPHLRINQSDKVAKTLFATALCEGHPYMKVLLEEAQKLYERNPPADPQPAKDHIANLVRTQNKDLHTNIIDHHQKASSAFRQALCEIPRILLEKDQKLLDGVIEGPFLDLADAILKSKDHCNQLATRERIVKAIENWISEKHQQSGNHHNQDDNNKNNDDDDDVNDDDDDDDDNDNEHDDGGGDDKEKKRRDLAIRVLFDAPEDVLRSPEVLTMIMKYNLLNEADILKTYAKNAKDDSKTTRVPFASFKPVVSFLKGVPGILHMAVFYQQRPLVETLLRCNAQLAVTRAYVQTTTAGATIPQRKETEASVETAAATVDVASVANGMPRDQEVQNADSGYYPLWFNNRTLGTDRAETWKEIRSALIYCIMKHAENVQTLLNALRESGEPENEINFDMSRLLIEGTSVADFVKSMPRQGRSYSLIRYEETIRYAEFPVLDLSTQPQTPAAQNEQRSHLQHAHEEILDMLNWLAGHGVRRIITLRVPDRMAHPHDELEIAGVVRRFRVEELDWRILDLSLNIFKPHGEPEDIPLVCPVDNNEITDNKPDKTGKTGRTGKTDQARDDKNEKNNKTSEEKRMQETYLRRLHLYTGGRRSALDHWFSREGLESMKLDHVYIHVIKELTTQEQSDTTLRYINTKIEELQRENKSMKIEVQSQFWTAQTETPRLQEIIHHLSPRLAQFIAHYRQTASRHHDDSKNFQPTKVAIIDNGILSMDPPSAPSRGAGSARPEDVPNVHGSSDPRNNSSEWHLQSQEFLTPDNLWARICDGKSFVHERDRVSPWYLASNPHGTQMANLVCAIDPLCQLFIAKIADSHYGYSAARAAKAVDWAIDRGVDIISMSFTTTEEDEKFIKAVHRAMQAGILVVCSHHDEGARIDKDIYPACLGVGAGNTMLRMASCNMYGKLLYDWDDNTIDDSSKKLNQYDFCINSQDVAVGAIPFLAASTERISGSSVATAIGAGLCSLLISCLRTLREASRERDVDQNSARSHTVLQLHKRLTRALDINNRPTYSNIETYLKTMAPSKTNEKFISLDRFAHLDELRDVNTSTLSTAFVTLGTQFQVKEKL